MKRQSIVGKIKTATAWAMAVAMPVLVSKLAYADVVDPVKPGHNQISGINVASGVTNLTEDISAADGGEFRKIGSGTLAVPFSTANTKCPWSGKVSVLGGSLKFSSAASAALGEPPAVFQKAAVWLDASTGVVVTNEAGCVSKWVDVRDAASPDAPTHVYATPAWGSLAPDKSSVPVKTTKDGRTALYFGGLHSGKFMRLSSEVPEVTHQFAVHGVYDCFGAVIGSYNRRYNMALSIRDNVGALPYPVSYHFIGQMELVPDLAAARHCLDGEVFDPFTTGPKHGFQLLSSHFMHKLTSVGQIFRANSEWQTINYEDRNANCVQGGDYVSEIVVFTERLSSGEIEDVTRYLMCKWNLSSTPESGPMPLPTSGTVTVAKDSTVEFAVPGGADAPFVDIEGSGLLKKSGSGTLELGPGNGRDGVSMSLEGGTILSRGGRPLPVAIAGGERYTASVYNVLSGSNRTRESDIASGSTLVKAADAANGVAVKAGDDWLRVNAVSSGVKRLKVNAGVLQLESKTTTTNAAAGAIDVAVPNADFEQPYSFDGLNAGRLYTTAEGVNGWRSSLGGRSAFVSFLDPNAATWFGTTVGYRPKPTSGSQVLLILDGAETDITFPKDGDYDLEFYASSRYGTGKGLANRGSFIRVFVVQDGVTKSVGDTVFPSGLAFTRFRVKMDGMKAGPAVLQLGGGRFNTLEDTPMVDDIRITYVGRRPVESAFHVPNGDFEPVTLLNRYPRCLQAWTLLNTVSGWTFGCDNQIVGDAATNALSGVVSPAFLDNVSAGYLLSDRTSDPYGSQSLLLAKTGGYASTTFMAPKGRFRLRGSFARRPWNFKTGSTDQCADAGTAKVKATLTLADSTSINLGTVSVVSRYDHRQTWGTSFEIPDAQSVTLTLEQTEDLAATTVDDLVFVTEAEELADNLFRVPDAEGSSSVFNAAWQCTNDRTYWNYSSAGQQAYEKGENTIHYGFSAFEGANAFSFIQKAEMTQTINVPEAGLHRFTCHVRTRASDLLYGGNDIRFWYVRQGSTETNVIDTLSATYAVNFLEKSWLVDFAEPGAYTFGMSSLGVASSPSTRACQTFLDGLSLRRVTESVADVPELDAETSVEVVEGARLVLDFPGTNTVRKVVYNGVRLPTGPVNAKLYPEFVGGIGTLMVAPPRGFVITFQ